MKARVFVSCGQRKGTDEEQVALQITEILSELGYDPYVAINEQTLRGLTENIFEQIASSEYFLFIDFRRERLADGDQCRGSLFSHQELAIASYLRLPILAFQQVGVKHPDGMLAAMQVNAAKFKNYEDLAPLVKDHLLKSPWNPQYKNLIGVEVATKPVDAVMRDSSERVRGQARYFHLVVRNLSQAKIALHCTAFLSRCLNEDTRTPVNYKQAEVRWAGSNFQSVNLFPGVERELDAVRVNYDHPSIGQFEILNNSSSYWPVCDGPGKFLLEYTVISENFPIARECFRLILGNTLDDAKLEPVDCYNHHDR